MLNKNSRLALPSLLVIAVLFAVSYQLYASIYITILSDLSKANEVDFLYFAESPILRHPYN